MPSEAAAPDPAGHLRHSEAHSSPEPLSRRDPGPTTEIVYCGIPHEAADFPSAPPWLSVQQGIALRAAREWGVEPDVPWWLSAGLNPLEPELA